MTNTEVKDINKMELLSSAFIISKISLQSIMKRIAGKIYKDILK